MATVTYAYGATNGYNINNLIQQLHAVMITAGWSLEYADADAIGAGTALAPAWDKAFASNQNVGIAVYRMPANGSLVQWYVRLRPRFGTVALGRNGFGVQIGTSHDGSGNVSSTVPNPEVGGDVHSSTQSDGQWWVSASEDHLLLEAPCANTSMAYRGAKARVERVRDSSGTVLDTVQVEGTTSSTTRALQLAHPTFGVVHNETPFVLASLTDSYGGGSDPMGKFDSAFLLGEPILGPFIVGGTPFYQTRSWFIIGDANALTAGDVVNIDIDGGLKAYVVRFSSSSPGWTAVATA
jgi:hypothetical protein